VLGGRVLGGPTVLCGRVLGGRVLGGPTVLGGRVLGGLTVLCGRVDAHTASSVVRRQCSELGEDVEEFGEEITGRYDVSPTLTQTVGHHIAADGRVDRFHVFVIIRRS